MAIVRIQLRRDTAADWTSANPVLAEGEMGVETDTDQFKIGDGATAWNSLSYGGLQGADGLPGIVASDVAPVDTDVVWLDTDDPLEPLVVPGGGTTGQVLSKASGDNYDTEWATVDLSTKQDDVITTQGDLVIGDGSGNPVRLPVGTADQVLTSDGTTVSFQDAGGGGFSSLLEITTSDASYTLPAGLGTVKLTVIGAGGGGAGVSTTSSEGPSGGSNGGNTVVTFTGGTVTAIGGFGAGAVNGGQAGQNGIQAPASYVSSNWGNHAMYWDGSGVDQFARPGMGGEIKVAYADFTGLTTIDVAIGAGGAGGSSSYSGAAGKNGIVILEY